MDRGTLAAVRASPLWAVVAVVLPLASCATQGASPRSTGRYVPAVSPPKSYEQALEICDPKAASAGDAKLAELSQRGADPSLRGSAAFDTAIRGRVSPHVHPPAVRAAMEFVHRRCMAEHGWMWST